MRSRKKPDSTVEAEAPDAAEVRARALKLLARREHSSRDLRRKLLERGYPAALITPVLADLAAENLLSDTRFAGEWVRSRLSRGQGPLKIRAELRRQGLSDAQVEQALEESGAEWARLAAEVRRKHFGARLPADYAGRARQARFLESRGFTAEHIRAALGGGVEDSP